MSQPMPKYTLHRCTICGTLWRLWDDSVNGGGWSLVDRSDVWPPGPCCDNVAMGAQIEQVWPLTDDMYHRGRVDALQTLARATRKVLTPESLAMLVEALTVPQPEVAAKDED